MATGHGRRVREGTVSSPAPRAAERIKSVSAPAAISMRVQRLLHGEFMADDLTHLFLYLRTASFGRQTIREVGDFVAHYGQREKGVTTDRAKNFFMILRFFVPLMAANIESISGLSVNPDFLAANFASVDPEVLRQETKMKPAVAKKVFRSLIAKMKEISGTANTRQLDMDESLLFRFLLSKFTAKPAFDDQTLIKELIEVLEKNRFIGANERKMVRQIGPLVSLYTVACMHDCRILLDDSSQAHLRATRHDLSGKR
jgi:hypothetical protein